MGNFTVKPTKKSLGTFDLDKATLISQFFVEDTAANRKGQLRI